MPIFKAKYQKNNKEKMRFIFASDMTSANKKALAYAIKNKLLLKHLHTISINLGNDHKELEMIFWQLGFFYKSGINILDSINSMRENTKSIKIINILDDMKECLNNGLPLSRAIKKHKNICGDFICLLFEVGEKTASVGEICDICHQDLKHKFDFRNSLKKALIYPFIVLIATISVFIMVSVFVIPEFSAIYNDFMIELPITTKILIFASKIFTVYYYELMLLLAALVVTLKYIFSKKFIVDKIYLKIPIINKIIIYYELYKYFLGLNIFLKSKVPFNESLKMCNNLINNIDLQKDFSKINILIDRGHSLSFSLSKLSTQIHNISLISSGEKSGNLDNALLINSEYYKKLYDDMLDNINKLAEPISIVVMGLLVALIAFGVITPIWNLVDIVN